MAEFLCKVADSTGRVFSQLEAAQTIGEARQKLLDRGLYVYSVRPRGGLLSYLVPRRRERLVGGSDFLIFNQQFNTLVKAGLPILKALDLLAERAASPKLRPLLTDVRERVREGESRFLRMTAPSLDTPSIGAARNPWRSSIRNASLIPHTPYCPMSSVRLFIAATACEGNRHATRHTQQWRLLHWHGMPPAPPDASLVTPCSVPQARLGIQRAPSASIEGSASLKCSRHSVRGAS